MRLHTNEIGDKMTNVYAEIQNSPELFGTVVDNLRRGHAVSVNWNDGAGSLLNVLFAKPIWLGGAGNRSQIMVAVENYGCYRFMTGTDASYITEKLKVTGIPTVQRLTDLINAVVLGHHGLGHRGGA